MDSQSHDKEPQHFIPRPLPVKIAVGLFWFYASLLAVVACTALWSFSMAVDCDAVCGCLVLLGGLLVFQIGLAVAAQTGHRFLALAGFSIEVLPFLPPLLPSCEGYWVCFFYVLPVVLMFLPVSNRWYRDKGKDRIGCVTGTLLIFAGILLLLAAFSSFRVNGDRGFIARTHSLARHGRTVHQRLVQVQVEKDENGHRGFEPASFSNSTDYVRSILSGEELDASLKEGKCRWHIAVNVPASVEDSFPMMISSNLDISKLPGEWSGEKKNGMRSSDEVIPIGPLFSGERMGKVAVVIRRNGSSDILKSKYCRPKIIFRDATYSVQDQIEYLTPTGRVRIGRYCSSPQ